jgi:hypothetical protein
MPEISRFNNMIILMNFNDHNPPHVHIKFNDIDCSVMIQTGEILIGQLPKKQLLMIQAWIEMHKNSLIFMWNNRMEEGTIFKLPPLS